MKRFYRFTSKSVYYVKAKVGYEYQLRTLIYDAKFKAGEETAKVMAWISFPNLLPTFFVKECLFSIGFYLRDEYGDVIYAAGREINKVTNTEAKTLAILEALRYSGLQYHHHVWLQTDSILLKIIVECS